MNQYRTVGAKNDDMQASNIPLLDIQTKVSITGSD